MDERLARLEKEARAGSDFAAEARDELKITRLAWGKQIDLTREAIVSNSRILARAEERALTRHGEAMEALREMREEIRAQTRAIWDVIDRMDRLDGGTSPA